MNLRLATSPYSSQQPLTGLLRFCGTAVHMLREVDVETNPLGRVAAGLLLEMVMQQGGSCECFELDALCDQTVKELGVICITQRDRFPRMVSGDIRREVIAQLNDLLRRGMLRFDASDRSKFLLVRTRDGIGSAVVESMLSVIRTSPR